MPHTLKIRHTPEGLDRLIEAVRRWNAPWITDIEKLNRVFQAAHNLVYSPLGCSLSMIAHHRDCLQLLREAVEDAEGMKKGEREMKKHFVEFYSPGTFVSEVSGRPINSWNVDKAVEMAMAIKERYGARPYGFRFTTRERGENDLDSHESAKSNLYYLGGRVETREEVEARNDPKEEILRSNMRINDISRIIINDNSWRFTAELNDDDVILDVKFPAKSEVVEVKDEG
jgi:hypothetical protein